MSAKSKKRFRSRDVSDGYETIDVRPQPLSDRPSTKDVWLYQCSQRKMALCISCAVKRRLAGKAMELVGDGKLVKGSCIDCSSKGME